MATTGQYGFLDNKNLIGIWDQMYEPALNGLWSTKIGTIVNSDLEMQPYAWLGAAPGLEELTDDNANEEQFGRYTYALRNIEYAKALRIKQTDMRRDKLGQLQLRIGEMSERAAEHWNVLAANTLLRGSAANATLINQSTGICYDGLPFFSQAHNEAASAGVATQANLLDSTILTQLDIVNPAAPTPLEAAYALNAVVGQFYLLVDDKNYPINGQAKQFKILVGTASMFSAFSQATSLMTFAQGAQNPVLGLKINNGLDVSVELIPQLAPFTTGFFVLRTDGRVKSLVLQNEVDVTPMTSNEQNDEFIKFRRYIFSIYASRACGYLRWQSAMQATFN